MIFKRIPLLLLTMCVVFSACAVAEEPTLAPKQDTSAASKADQQTSTKVESTDAKSTVTELKPIPEGTVVEGATTSTVPTHVYPNRAYGYSRQQIRSMPMVARPDRPGHFLGNTVRAIHRSRRGR